jgi:hypothetical protein
MDWDRIHEQIKKKTSQFEKHVFFLSILAQALEEQGHMPPFVVGGNAVEIYTQSSYATKDLDIKCHYETLEFVANALGFRKVNRQHFSKELGLYIDWLGDAPKAPHENDKLAIETSAENGAVFRVIAPEDIIIARLNEAKHWNNDDARLWAEQVAETALRMDRNFDWSHINKRAAEEDIVDEVEALRAHLEAIPSSETQGPSEP